MRRVEITANNDLDRDYLLLLADVKGNGFDKETRAGEVRSVFGRQMHVNLMDGFPLLTTKKVFAKGIIHELLWFLNEPCNAHNSMNIKYLLENNVHIWDDDAWRWFKIFVETQIMDCEDDSHFSLFAVEKDQNKGETYELLELGPIEKMAQISQAYDNKEYFLDLTLNEIEIVYIDRGTGVKKYYRFGDLGPIYGKQWRMFGSIQVDQIQNVIDTLKSNPDDRRMLCVAYKPDELKEMALPPCHVMFQFYTRPLSYRERWKVYMDKYEDEPLDAMGTNEYIMNYGEATSDRISRTSYDRYERMLDEEGISKLGLSCMFTMRSVDLCCGLPFNIASYALLTSMIAKLVGMVPDTLVCSLGDCHIYKNHFDGVEEQLSRDGAYNLPRLIINGDQETINDFKFEDFEIRGYEPDAAIKYQLNVG